MTTHIAQTPVGVLVGCGKDRVDLLHRLSTNDLRPLSQAGQVRSTVFTTEKGRILDWTWVYARETDLVIRTSQGRAAHLSAWLDKFTIMEDFTTRDESDAWVMVTVQGPQALELVGQALPAHQTFTPFAQGMFACGLAAYGQRYECLVPKAVAQELMRKAKALGVVELPANTQEQLRIDAGVPSPEHEFKDEVNPLELRINEGVISWTKGCYIGQEVIARLDSYDKLARQLMGFRANAELLPSSEARLFRDGKTLGRITSAYLHNGQTVGLAVVKREAAHVGVAELRDATQSTEVVLEDRPFWLT